MGIAGIPGGIALPALLVALSGGAGAMDLREALETADRQGWGNRISSAREEQAAGQELSAWAGIVPSARAELGMSATDDPMGAFGSRLGQRRISMASFDPAALNDPEAVAGWNAALVAEIPLVNVDAWNGAGAAADAARARRAEARLERERTRAEVVKAWYSVGLSRQAVAAWDTALAVARSYLEQAASGVRNQTALRSDSLRAAVEADRIRAELSKARTGERLALRRLALLLGRDSLEAVEPADLPDSVLEGAVEAAGSPEGAADVEQARWGREAARQGAAAARGAFLPRLNGIARLDWKARISPASEDPSWTVGLVASWSVPGPASLGAARTAAGRAREAEAGEAALRARRSLELEAERSNLSDALARLSVLRGSLAQAAEAHRIVRRRWEEGLATAADRIEAGALETRIRLEAVSLRREIVGSLAEIRLLEGRDPAALASLLQRN